jgi:hypothetical protein
MTEPIRNLSEIKPGDILRRVAKYQTPGNWGNECLVEVVSVDYCQSRFYKEYLEGPMRGMKADGHLDMDYNYFHHTEAEPENMWV